MFRRCSLLLCSTGAGPFDPYKILGVAPNASKRDIKSAYHRLVLKYHPDTGPEGNAARFNAVHEAYQAVKDGTWKPSAETQRQTAENEGHGWDPKMRMYVYEKPGSTTEGYVTGQTQLVLKVVMVVCFLFVFIRFAMLWSSKPVPREGSALQQQAPIVSADSVHSGDAHEVQWRSFANSEEQERTATTSPLDETVDPFARK